MRTCRTAPFLAVLAIAIVACLGIVAVRPSAKPSISVTILGYTMHGNRLCARVSLTNLGRSSVCYNEGGLAVGFDMFNTSRSKGRASVSYIAGDLAGPDGWLGAESSRGWTQREIGGVILSPRLLQPGSNTIFTIVLPPDTLRWQAGFRVRAASLRELAAWNLRSKWFARIWPLFRLVLPDNKGPEQEIRTALFELPLVLAPPDMRHEDHTAAGDGILSGLGGPLPWER